MSELYCLQVRRIRESYGDLFLPIVVVSTDEDERLFTRHGIETHRFPNFPLPAKFQYGLDQLRDRVDAVFFLDDDDLINNTLIDKIISQGEELVWPIGLYMANSKSGEIRVFDWFYRKYSSVGRLARKSLLDRLDWKLWLPVSGMCVIDYHSHQRLLTGKPTMKMVDMLPDGVMLDIKGDVNINSYLRFSKGGKVASDLILDSFSEAERKYFHRLCQQ